MYYPFPDISERCLMCGMAGCARWKGYYLRRLRCAVVEFDGKVAIHVGRCRTQKRDFSYSPSFVIPYRQISRMSLLEFIFQWHPLGKVQEGIDWFLEGIESGSERVSEAFKLATSTAYGWIYGLATLLRLHSDTLQILPPESISIRAVRTSPVRILKHCFDPVLNWTPGIDHIRAPPLRP
jgi:hypothetical protein